MKRHAWREYLSCSILPVFHESRSSQTATVPPTNHHHGGSQQALSDLALSQKQLCPQDGEESTPFENGSDIPNQAQGDGSKPKEWSDPCNVGGKQEQTRMRTQSAQTCERDFLVVADRRAQRSRGEQAHAMSSLTGACNILCKKSLPRCRLSGKEIVNSAKVRRFLR